MKLVAPEEFWVELRAGATVAVASGAVGVSHFTGYRWMSEAGARLCWVWSSVGDDVRGVVA